MKTTPNTEGTGQERIELDSRVSATDDQISCEVTEEVVVLGLSTGMYYGLTGVAAVVWNELREPRTVWQLRDALVERFAVGAERCTEDLLRLLEDLGERRLIEVQSPPGSRR